MVSEKVGEWADLLKVLANPVRLALIADLLEGPKCVKQVRDLLQVSQLNGSQDESSSGSHDFLPETLGPLG